MWDEKNNENSWEQRIAEGDAIVKDSMPVLSWADANSGATSPPGPEAEQKQIPDPLRHEQTKVEAALLLVVEAYQGTVEAYKQTAAAKQETIEAQKQIIELQQQIVRPQQARPERDACKIL